MARFALFLPKKTETMKKTCALEISYLRYLVCIFTRYFFLALLQATHNFYIAKLCSDVGFFFTLLPWNGTVTKTVPNSSLRTAPRKISGSCVKWKKKCEPIVVVYTRNTNWYLVARKLLTIVMGIGLTIE